MCLTCRYQPRSEPIGAYGTPSGPLPHTALEHAAHGFMFTSLPHGLIKPSDGNLPKTLDRERGSSFGAVSVDVGSSYSVAGTSVSVVLRVLWRL